MEKAWRLKPAYWLVEIGFPVVLMTIVAGIIAIFAGEMNFRVILVALFIGMGLFHLIFLLRLGNPFHLVPMLFYLSGSATFVSAQYAGKIITTALAAVSGGLFLLFMWVLIKRRIKWRYREVLELAARSVRSAKDGYTDRPFPAGEINVKPEQLESFSTFLSKHGIAWSIMENDKQVWVIPENLLFYLLGLKKDYQNETFVKTDENGNLSVKISQKSYRLYRQEYTFDHLNAALGNLFIHFLHLHEKGKDKEIIRRMDDLQLLV